MRLSKPGNFRPAGAESAGFLLRWESVTNRRAITDLKLKRSSRPWINLFKTWSSGEACRNVRVFLDEAYMQSRNFVQSHVIINVW